MRDQITTLKHGDPVPAEAPARYFNQQGYVRLRWKVAPWTYVEAYEHRVVMGLPPDEIHVHHRNHDRADNRPENLELVEASVHIADHAEERRLNVAHAYELYSGGMRLADVAAVMGCHPASLSKAFAREGLKARTRSEATRMGWQRRGSREERVA